MWRLQIQIFTEEEKSTHMRTFHFDRYKKTMQEKNDFIKYECQSCLKTFRSDRDLKQHSCSRTKYILSVSTNLFTIYLHAHLTYNTAQKLYFAAPNWSGKRYWAARCRNSIALEQTAIPVATVLSNLQLTTIVSNFTWPSKRIFLIWLHIKRGEPGLVCRGVLNIHWLGVVTVSLEVG